jgi:outer membrane receptor protein involved in Fe transport
MRPSFLYCLLLASLATSDAMAQRQTPRDSAQALPRVTVAVTRSPAAILSVPLAITKISASELRSVSGFGLDDALSRVPGVIAQSRYGTSDIRLMIRGFGARGRRRPVELGTSRGVRVLLDGFPEDGARRAYRARPARSRNGPGMSRSSDRTRHRSGATPPAAS